MTPQDFAAWATQNGLNADSIEQLIDYAATPEQIKAASDAMEIGPPTYTLKGIQKLHDGDEMGISPAASGFMIIGGCPNGDPIAFGNYSAAMINAGRMGVFSKADWIPSRMGRSFFRSVET